MSWDYSLLFCTVLTVVLNHFCLLRVFKWIQWFFALWEHDEGLRLKEWEPRPLLSAETLYCMYSVFMSGAGLSLLSVTVPLNTLWCQGETLLPAARHMQLHTHLYKHQSMFCHYTLLLCLKWLVLCIVSFFGHIRISGQLCIYSWYCCSWQQYKMMINEVHYLGQVMLGLKNSSDITSIHCQM